LNNPGAALGKPEAGAEKNLSDNEKTLLRLLKDGETRSLDQLSAQTELTSGAIAVSLLNLELNGLVRMQPGNMCRLVV
jgi:predicted Rossmann fold nucleotide-binding protein DprA/Smf involved in DNA uptake